MNAFLPPNLPPLVRILLSYWEGAVKPFNLTRLACFFVFLTILHGCAAKSAFDFDKRVFARESSIRSSRLLTDWAFYSVKVISTKSGCRTSTGYRSDSYIIGSVISTTTTPVDSAACFEGDDLTREEIENYELLRVAITAREKGATSFFRLGRTYWVPLKETSYDQLESVFVPKFGDDRVDIQIKGTTTVLNQVPYKKMEMQTKNRYFYHTKLNRIFDETELTFPGRMESETEYDYLKRSISQKPHYDRMMSWFDPDQKGLDKLIEEGVIIPRFHTEEALVPVFPKPLVTDDVIRGLSEKLSLKLGL